MSFGDGGSAGKTDPWIIARGETVLSELPGNTRGDAGPGETPDTRMLVWGDLCLTWLLSAICDGKGPVEICTP